MLKRESGQTARSKNLEADRIRDLNLASLHPAGFKDESLSYLYILVSAAIFGIVKSDWRGIALAIDKWE